jgi:ligand-binding sensor domain-containing protein/class 3 adenylate cyclase
MRFCLSVVLSVAIAGLYALPVRSQQFNFKTYTTKHGLGSSIVNCIFQDSRGDIWFGTQSGGVSRFNGSTFKTYNQAKGLVGNDVTCITEDRDGNIWIGTSEGASKFNGTGFRNYNDSSGLVVNKGIYSILVDDQGIVWFGSRGGGLIRMDGTGFRHFTTEDGLPSNSVFAIAQTHDKRIWLSCSKGIASFDGNSFETYQASSGKTYFSIATGHDGSVWFGGTPGNGVLQYKNGRLTSVDLPLEVKDDFIGALVVDDRDRIWLATDHGVLKLQDGEFQLFTQEMGLSANGILSVATDIEGNIWIGTQGGGVNLLSNEAFISYTDKHGLSNSSVNAVEADTVNHRIFLGTARGGINIMNTVARSKFEKLTGVPELDDLNIYTLLKDPDGKLLIGAQEGLYVLAEKSGRFSLELKLDEVAGKRITAVNGIVRNAANDYWISSYGAGLLRWNDGEVRAYNTDNGFPSDDLLSIFADRNESLWIGTQDAGIIVFKEDTFVRFSSLQPFPDVSVWAIAQDSEGVMYFGTSDRGLYRFDGSTLRNYDMMFGSVTNRVKSLHWDPQSNSLWVGTPEGVHRCKFDLHGNIIEMRTYSERDGLPTFEIDQNAIEVDGDGTVWFGSTNGITAYRPKYDHTRIQPPQIRLESILLAHERVDWLNYSDSVDPFTGVPLNLVLGHRNNHLTFEVRALTTDKVSYSFKLLGQDDHWSPFSPNPSVQYANISPGDYTFMVKAINSNRVETESEFSYSFTIEPPWWSRWYVQLAFAMLLTGAIVLIIKAREQVLREQNRVLEETVAERTAEVVKEKAEVEKQYNRSEELLLNILPVETAQELKAKGHVDAKLIDEVTVLFTDFKGFTALSEILAPKDLVNDIHECFSEFDRIMAKHGVEKIKTIGDAYMAAGGLPRPNETHAVDVVRAALEMVAFVESGKVMKKLKGLPFFEIRVGVHTGPVVAGIVGIKKFQYDIWGDTVNTASRMESSGEVGRVNISEATYELVKDHFMCEYRGKVAAKGKGEISMYFVHGEKPIR